MENKKIKLWILHAGLGHPSPYFYNLCNEFRKFNNIDITVNPDLPLNVLTNDGVVYFNRLKRYYDSNDINSINEFLHKVDKLKNNGWKLIFTIHNFFPIDRKTTQNDEILLKRFLPKMDIVFTFTNYMKKSLKKNFGVNAINHSIGKYELDKSFDIPIKIPNIEKDAFVFTFIGNISEYKMLDSIINNFIKINNKKTYLIIAGPDNKFFNLKYEENKNIIRINQFIGDKAWKSLCNLTNVFINSYDTNRECFKYGFFPSNCIQIIENKKFCIVPKCKVIEEILPNGYYYTYKSKNNIYKVMKKAIKNKKYIIEKEKCYPDYYFSWANMVQTIILAIQEELI